MLKKALLTLSLIIGMGMILLAQTSLQGKVTNLETGEPVLFGTVALYKNGVLATGTETDFDGNFSFSNIDPGTYDVEVSYVGYQSQRIEKVVVLAGKANKLDVKLSEGVTLDEIEVVDYKVPLIEQDNTTSGGVVTAEKIRNLPTKSINALAATTAGLSSIDGGAITVRGSRSNATDYYIDGIRVSGSMVPQSEIDQMQVITGGIEAKYGDVTGGIISITTKGPSAKFSGGLELESSQYLDPYGYNLGSLNLSGPILKNKEGKSIVGFRLSGQYLNREDDDPPAIGVYRLPEGMIEELEANPITFLSGTPLASAEFLGDEDAKLLDSRPNERNERLDVTAKIDARISPAVDITFTGAYRNTKNRFTPGGWGLLNYPNNPFAYGENFRGNIRFRHRLGGTMSRYSAQLTDEEKAKRNTVIRNASYALQFGYEKGYNNREDLNHENRLFDYGYVGNFDVEWIPVEGESEWSQALNIFGAKIAHAGHLRVLNGYTAGEANPVLANYNNTLENIRQLESYYAFNGTLSGNFSDAWNLHNNVGMVYNTFNKGESDRFTFSASSAFDFLPGGSEKGRHNIQFGIIYEQRVGRSWGVAPRGLWTVARLQANKHIIGVDTNMIIGNFNGVVFPDIVFDEFQTLIAEDEDLLFYQRIRELTGQSLHEYVNVDGIAPEDLSLDMFSAAELNDQGIIGYYGYDYLGGPLDNNITFDDFFTSVDENGRRDFPVAPNRPVYQAAFIQDKFTFRDIIFRLGLRVDRYDANTKVMKDPFSLYDIMTAKDFYEITGDEKPLGVEDDFKVYVSGDNSDDVKAFRRDEQWYNAQGTAENDGNLIFGGEIVYPKFVDPDADVQSNEFNPKIAFEDYDAQINWMPRLAFSFPISDAANFFAHYDILVQRPPSNTLATALSYYYFEEAGRTPTNNPNLKPERTIDYEVGFQQKLSNSSALKIAAYYKEMRDMIQARTYLYLPPPVNTYESYGNLDFGTVKGFSFQYDLRRTGNIEVTANYTLQFAEGTGSSANSQRGLTSRGNIRTIYPLSFDERHRFVTTFDFRYGSGKQYNGPRISGLDIFANAGLNLTANAVSGRPYTRRTRAEPFSGTGFVGSLNGARLPWNYTVDLRADKSFQVSAGSRPVFVNVYLRVQNLLDTRNVLGVYPVTGTADDDGYLTSTDGQSALNTISTSGRDVGYYLASYQWRLLNPNLYSLPRRVYLGAILEF